jgi:hypothetical protein
VKIHGKIGFDQGKKGVTRQIEGFDSTSIRYFTTNAGDFTKNMHQI